MRIDWINCSDIEIKLDVMSGTPVIRGTRAPAQAVLDNADDGYTAEEIVADIYPSLPVEPTRRVIEFARRAYASAPFGLLHAPPVMPALCWVSRAACATSAAPTESDELTKDGRVQR